MKILLIFTLLTITFALHSKEALEIHFFDVGQADSQLLVFPSGYSILIDVGDYTRSQATNTKHVAKRIEAILGHKSIDVFVLSHYHMDHAGEYGLNGIWYLLEKAGFTVKKYVKRHAGSYKGDKLANCNKNTFTWKYAGDMTDSMAKTICYAASIEPRTKLSQVAQNAKICSTTQIVPPDDGAKVTILMRDALGIKDPDTGEAISKNTVNKSYTISENDLSICLRIQFNDFVFATCGDISGYTKDADTKKFYDVETPLAPMMGEVDLLKVNHHGANTGTNDLWCNTLKPTVSIITCGQGSDLPEQKPLRRLQNVGSTIYTTGTECHQSNINAVGGIKQMGGDIFVSVTLGRETFKVSNADGSEYKTYQIKKNKKAPKACQSLE